MKYTIRQISTALGILSGRVDPRNMEHKIAQEFQGLKLTEEGVSSREHCRMAENILLELISTENLVNAVVTKLPGLENFRAPKTTPPTKRNLFPITAALRVGDQFIVQVVKPGNDCPGCHRLGKRRHGREFEHEYRCADCRLVWDPDLEYLLVTYGK